MASPIDVKKLLSDSGVVDIQFDQNEVRVFIDLQTLVEKFVEYLRTINKMVINYDVDYVKKRIVLKIPVSELQRIVTQQTGLSSVKLF